LKNTKLLYLYTDADNYKQWNEAVLEGEITEEQKSIIMDSLDADNMFIPSLIGLPENRFEHLTTADHIWFEMKEIILTDEEADTGLTVEEVVEGFQKQKGIWEVNADLIAFEMRIAEDTDDE
jgi:hypothetical protein